ncbi:hypothetical protein ABCR94_17485 [Streptomyces sp. 21So2-11]|uniref:hypothetical protein n=1 Tax=Streptomyces sp. 21So2-11 TaxID=3144408 RepID=UPI0032199A58
MAMALSAAVALGLGAGACGESAPRAEGVSASREAKAPTGSASALPSEAESAAFTAYRAMWADAVEASRTSDSKHPRLDDHAKEKALWLLQFMMEEIHKAGATSTGGVSVEPRVAKADKSKVELLDCVDGTKWVQVKPNGSPDGLPGGHYRTEATVVLADGKWTVSDLYWGEAGTCLK